ncbi:MAG: hypothetical protein JKY51_06085 [Opitutaceae bacterium]|nr:hypothetical protein [Opitutaceae bacterium]
MPSLLLSIEGIVLSKELSGDSWLRLIVFSAQNGNVLCLKRLSQRKSLDSSIDFFDELQLNLESRNQGRSWFISEYHHLNNSQEIGKNYDALIHASRFTKILAGNTLHEESRRPVYQLFKNALSAWRTGIRPEVTLLKSIYILARDEGYPVKEDWCEKLPTRDRASLRSILSSPVVEQKTSEQEAHSLLLSLEHYLNHYTDIQMPT